MKGKILTTFIILLTIILTNCQKGDPGPTGAAGATGVAGPDSYASYINGSFSGTVIGTKKDGTTLNETFNYTYSKGPEGYTTVAPYNLYLSRSDAYSGSNFMRLVLLALNKGQANQTIAIQKNLYYDNYFHYSKESGNELFVLDAPMIFLPYDVVIPVDPSNTNYPFTFTFYYYGSGDYNFNSNFISENNNQYIGMYTKSGEVVYYNYPNPGTFYKIVDAAGNVSTSSSTYGGLVLNSTSDGHYYFKDQAGNDLSKKVTMPADTYSITNYTYDATKSNLSFNFIINLSGYPFPNTTTNPLKITGTFTGKVYDKISNGIIKSEQGEAH
jgi:hypothetical protein